ncbi:MAG: NAD(P)-dependent glycerol-3-phosphate dehydrogenase [Sphingomonadales bacterium]|nr:NAD(P)-dependent glycerol-3-phosphate dehydrogenase [Sphingomonadales bacterium]PIX67242.1 MAG: glycerol-3-phosphate dehydrogenase [Sphingomonadales bacterium CG_4_10_14_3_um_filter_58_15]NCO48681.1 NAD(P)-dependent glycerol-3-phosphate dehydrogenase [Sphingomonadales bacterium]NCO99574.1 NAD(P)-dependent glycerol-3-phosphate dehydrogenase [Sphingomonadales bacterium]NCP25956.1 NAD(P)-dependent glycerol-3-phosphate dehydrogenase [Sphingomonadales bacterium]
MIRADAKIGVIGAGAWGTALAQVLSEGQEELLLWARETEVVDQINQNRENQSFLSGHRLRDNIRATQDWDLIAACDVLLLVTPAQHLRASLEALPNSDAALILCCKGIEAQTQMLLSDVAKQVRPNNPLAILSGPTFAREVAQGLPTALTLACENEALWERLNPVIAKPSFRPYFSDDIIGAEIGGAVKNVLAIGCGVVDGAGLGQNARASLIGRGFAEMLRYGETRGAKAETLSGLCGLGDLVLTCSSTSSRNFSLGRGLGEGQSAVSLLSDRTTVAEGASTAPVLQQDARARQVDMPIVDAVCALLAGEADVQSVVTQLMKRPLVSERR